MRVLILSQYYDPEPVEKVHDLARGLVGLGHEVYVITGFPCYPQGKIYPGYRQALTQEEDLDGVHITRIPQIPDHSRSAWRRIIYYLSFALSAAIIGPIKAPRVDVMLVYQAALPISLSAWIISRLRRIPFVLDVVDLWPESVIASGMLNNQVIVGLLRRVAQWLYQQANHISVVTRGFQSNLLNLGIPSEKITVIHNWMPAATYSKPTAPASQIEHEKLTGKFNVVYAGNMGPSQNLKTVIEAAELLQDFQQIQFVLVGDGLEFSELVELSRKKGLQNVLFLGRYPPEVMPGLYAMANVLLVHLKPDLLSDISIPSKTFAYLASGRPVLMAVRGEATEFVSENGFGLAVEPSNPVKMAEAVQWFYEAPSEILENMGRAALTAYEQCYCSSVQITRMANLLTAAVKN